MEETHSLNLNSRVMEVVLDFSNFSSVINPNGDCSQDTRRLRPGRAAMEELERPRCVIGDQG